MCGCSGTRLLTEDEEALRLRLRAEALSTVREIKQRGITRRDGEVMVAQAIIARLSQTHDIATAADVSGIMANAFDHVYG